MFGTAGRLKTLFLLVLFNLAGRVQPSNLSVRAITYLSGKVHLQLLKVKDVLWLSSSSSVWYMYWSKFLS